MSENEERKLVAALACRNQGSRLYGKPLQNLDVDAGISILDNIVSCLRTMKSVQECVLGVAEGNSNLSFQDYAKENDLRFIVGSERDVLWRLIECGKEANASDIFRVTSESPFPSYEFVDAAWEQHLSRGSDATFFDDVIDGCGFEIIKLDALREAHDKGEDRHRSELCTLYIRENTEKFKVEKFHAPSEFNRKDLRLTVDNPEDLIVCKAVYTEFKNLAPLIPLSKIIDFLDKNEDLVKLVYPFTEQGYASMYIWNENEKK